MSLAFSFPGIYIQELPLSSHAITPAPTSIAAFIGYAHPYRTPKVNLSTATQTAAVQIFSFTDFETAFGGLFTSGLVDPNLGRAVFNFFLNGGSQAWIVGLQPNGLKSDGTTVAPFGNDSGDIQFTGTVPTTGTSGIVFTAQELCDVVPMVVAVSNIRGTNSDTFDCTITYGTRNEIFRGVTLGGIAAAFKASTLVTVSAASGGFGTTFTAPNNVNVSVNLVLPSGTQPVTTSFNPNDFINAMNVNTALDKVEIFNLLVIPGVSDNSVVSAAVAFAERKRAFAILDPPPNAVADALVDPNAAKIADFENIIPKSQNGALYFPYLLSTDPVTDTTMAVPPSGFVAGIYARIDASRGVWKAPAGIEASVLNTVGPVATGLMNDPQQGVLNVLAINVIRQFNAIGTVVFGARTLVGADANTAFPQSKYVPVRRMTLFIEQSLLANLKWVVFEPNAEPLWVAIRATIEAFLLSLFNQGALAGSTPSQAFQVKVDSTTTTPADQANGVVNIIVAFAPLRPAEFVVIKISQLAGQTAGT